MATTTYRAITTLEVGQSGKEAVMNAALDNLSRGLSGIVSVAVTSSNVTLTDADENDEAKHLIVLLTGASTGARQVIVPTSGRAYIVANNTTGGFTHTVKTAAGTGVTVAPSAVAFVACDGTNVIQAGASGVSFTTEDAQDAVGAMVDSTLVYVDGTPLLTRAALTGDVTASQGSNALTIANDAVTYAKLQNVSATDRLLGRDTAGAGDTEELTVSGGVEFTGSGGIQRSALTGDVTATAGSNSTTIANDAVTYAKMQNVSAASKLLGRGDSGSGDPQEITLGSGLSMSGTTLSSTASGSTQGRHTMWIPASAMTPAATNGATANQREMSSNKNNHRVMEFPDGASAKYVHFSVAFPKAWNESTVTYEVLWTLNSTSTNTAVFGLQGVATSNNDVMDVAFGTAVTVSDAGLGTTALKMHRSAESSAVTIAGTPAEGDLVEFRFYRDPTDGSDNLAVTAEVLGVNLFYTTNADTDA